MAFDIAIALFWTAVLVYLTTQVKDKIPQNARANSAAALDPPPLSEALLRDGLIR